jgi:LEA14-like dessication related protein
MKPEVKKWLIVGGLGVISIALAAAYLQYKKLMNYTIKLKGFKLKTITPQLINFDLFINFSNNSDLKFVISDQEYKVYLNNQYVTKLVNSNDVVVQAKSTSVIPVNIQFNPSEVLKLLGQNALTILASPQKIIVKVDVKLKVALYGIKFSIPYVYESTLKELMTPTPTA